MFNRQENNQTNEQHFQYRTSSSSFEQPYYEYKNSTSSNYQDKQLETQIWDTTKQYLKNYSSCFDLRTDPSLKYSSDRDSSNNHSFSHNSWDVSNCSSSYSSQNKGYDERLQKKWNEQNPRELNQKRTHSNQIQPSSSGTLTQPKIKAFLPDLEDPKLKPPFHDVFEVFKSDGIKTVYTCKICKILNIPDVDTGAHVFSTKHKCNLKAIEDLLPGKTKKEKLKQLKGILSRDGRHNHKSAFFTIIKSIKRPLVGLGYVIEILNGNFKEPMYMCALCNKNLDRRSVEPHLVSQNHKLFYLRRHFKPIIDRLESVRRFLVDINFRNDCLNKICKKIDKNTRRASAFIYEGTDFVDNKIGIFETVNLRKHVSIEDFLNAEDFFFEGIDQTDVKWLSEKPIVVSEGLKRKVTFSGIDEKEPEDKKPRLNSRKSADEIFGDGKVRYYVNDADIDSFDEDSRKEVSYTKDVKEIERKSPPNPKKSQSVKLPKMTAIQSLLDISIPTEEPQATLLTTCRMLSTLETELGLLAPKVIDLMSKSIAYEREHLKSSDELLFDTENLTLIETVREKIIGMQFANLIESNKKLIAEKAVDEIKKLIAQHEIMINIKKTLTDIGMDEASQPEISMLVAMLKTKKNAPETIRKRIRGRRSRKSGNKKA